MGQFADGVVLQVLPDGLVEVQLVGAHRVVAHLGTEARMQTTRLRAGDEVVVALSPFDDARGRILSRKR